MVEEGTTYICKPQDSAPTFFTVQMILPSHDVQSAPHRVLNENGMVCYLRETGDTETPYVCVIGLEGDGEHKSEVIAAQSEKE